MFEIGEKIVSIKNWNDGWNNPKENEIVTILTFDENGYIILMEYRYEDGEEQCFNPAHFRKLDHSFAENLLEKIKREVSNDKVAQAIA